MKKQTKKQYSKRMVTVILAVAIFDLQLSYALAFFDKEIAENLAIAIVTEIIAVALGYFCKSFFETKSEKQQNFEEKKYEDERAKLLDESEVIKL